MRKLLLWMCLWGCIGAVAAQDENTPTVATVLPGKGHIDVEKLNGPIDMGMDISQLTVSELRVLRNAFAARQGYCFMEADLRELFSATSWYERLLYMRFDEWDIVKNCKVPPMKPVTYTKAESAFMAKLKKREDELKRGNFTTSATGGQQPVIDNLVNPYQLVEMPTPLRDHLAADGFAIVPANYQQLFHVYEKNDYSDFPSFVTTDLYLQLFHLYFDSVLRRVETTHLYGQVETFCQDLYKALWSESQGARGKGQAALAEWNAAYLAVALQLLTGHAPADLPAAYVQMVDEEVAHATKAEDDFSKMLDYRDVKFGYGIFRPRGHYTRTDSLSRYFRSLMWLQTVPFGTDKDEQLRRSLLLAETIGKSKTLTQQYQRITEPLTWLMGAPDNVTIMQVYDAMQATGLPFDKLLADKKAMARLRKDIEALGEQQTRIRPKFERTSHCKINLMPQRYQPDAEVLQEMVDYDSPTTQRDVPSGLDVLAALGASPAERILVDELREPARWSGFTPMLDKMKKRMQQVDWSATIATRWVDALGELVKHDGTQPSSLPYFMQGEAWGKKDVNAALASWAELKHDAILYAKQPMGAECGDGGPPAPIVRGYVEPNVGFWRKAIDLLNATNALLERYGYTTPEIESVTGSIRSEAAFLLACSEKELAGTPLNEEENGQIEVIGSTFENISLDLVRDPDQWLQWWSDVQGTDRNVALVADVYTANADNNPNKSVLYEAVGPADEIYVVVEINGYLYLTRGAVLSYREFKGGLSAPRLTDEEWQQQLKTQPRKGVPTWMKGITVPLDPKSMPIEDNDDVFYSSGC